MNQEIIKQIQDIFTPIAEKIGQGAGFGWEVVLKQQYIDGFLFLFFGVIGLVVFISLLIYIIKAKDKDSWYEDAIFGAIIILILLFVFGSLFSVIGIKHLFNPEYYAIEFFINLVK